MSDERDLPVSGLTYNPDRPDAITVVTYTAHHFHVVFGGAEDGPTVLVGGQPATDPADVIRRLRASARWVVRAARGDGRDGRVEFTPA